MEKDIRANLDQPSVPDQEESDDEAGKSEEVEAAPEAEQPEVDADAPQEEAEVEAEDTGVEKDPPRVPYSRFETVNEARVRAEEELRLMKADRERERLQQAAAPNADGLPAYWVKLYGDSDASKEAYALRQQELKEERESLRSSIREDMQREQAESEQRVENTVDEWSNQIDDFAAKNKRKFTDAQTDSILDVMDELTPKDTEGNYVVEPIQYLARAVELYDLRQDKALASKKQARQSTAKLTAAKSEGIPSDKTENWTGDWEKKLTRMGR